MIKLACVLSPISKGETPNLVEASGIDLDFS